MNIFALHPDPIQSAVWQHDRHVVKMTLETAQLLSTAVWHNPMIREAWESTHGPLRPGIDSMDSGSLRLYKSISNPNHPIAVWARDSWANFAWTVLHLNGLIGEYHRRFRKVHACDAVRWSFNKVLVNHLSESRMFQRDESRAIMLNPSVRELASQHSPFVQAMPDEYKHHNPCTGYLTLYLESKIFQEHVKWTRCSSIPEVFFSVVTSERSMNRLAQLVRNHQLGLQALTPSLPSLPLPHPDLLKPINPKALTRFGKRPL